MAGKGINYPLVISGVVCQLGAGIMYTLKSTKASTIEQVLRLGGLGHTILGLAGAQFWAARPGAHPSEQRLISGLIFVADLFHIGRVVYAITHGYDTAKDPAYGIAGLIIAGLEAAAMYYVIRKSYQKRD